MGGKPKTNTPADRRLKENQNLPRPSQQPVKKPAQNGGKS